MVRKQQQVGDPRGFGRVPRPLLAVALLAVIVGLPATSHGQSWLPIPINFDTVSLATSGNTPASGVVPYNGGVVGSLSDSTVYVSFLAGNNLTATIGSGTLAYASGTWNWSSGTVANSYVSTMSQSFAIADLKTAGLQLVDANASRMYISYGINAYDKSAQPVYTDGGRFSYVELNYKTNGGNGVDLSSIEQFSGSLSAKSYAAPSAGGGLLYATGNTPSTQQLMTQLVTAAGGTGAGSTWVPTNGSAVVRVTGPSTVVDVASPFTNFQPYLASVYASGSSELQSPTMTLMRDPYTPQPTAGFRSGTAVGALNWSGGIGFVSNTAANGVTGSTTYNTGYFFKPSVTRNVTASGTYYGVVFTGSVSVCETTAAAGTTTPTKWYDGLTINVNTGTDGAAINSYLQSGGPTGVTNITLSGTGWSQFSTDFCLGSGTSNAGAAAPDFTVVGGANSQYNSDYGQIVQKVIGDFQEGVNAGLYANAVSGSYNYWLFSNGASALNTTGTIGVLPSSVWFQNPALAYGNSGSGAQNTYAAVIWKNSYQLTASGSYAYGGVYGAPFDDRFGSPYVGSFGNTFPLDDNGGSLTIVLNEAITAVPEPAACMTLFGAATTVGALIWHRGRNRRRPAVLSRCKE
jgi:hypothetical protein